MNYNELLNEVSLFLEKKTKEEYMIDKLQKRYGYVPDKGTRRTGTIDVDGKRIKIDMKRSNTVYSPKYNQKLPRQTAYNIGDDVVIVDPQTLSKLKGKRKFAVLQHELGHAKMHSQGSASDGSATLKNTKGVQNGMLGTLGVYPGDEAHDAYAPEVRKTLKDVGIGYQSKNKGASASRDKFINSAKTYENLRGSTGHANVNEFEADRYAANRAGEKNIARGVRQMYKVSNSPKELRRTISTQLKLSGLGADELSDKDLQRLKKNYLTKPAQVDMAARTAALKDKDISSNEYYKPTSRPKVSSSVYQKSKKK